MLAHSLRRQRVWWDGGHNLPAKKICWISVIIIVFLLGQRRIQRDNNNKTCRDLWINITVG